jgi:hypothetical protein
VGSVVIRIEDGREFASSEGSTRYVGRPAPGASSRDVPLLRNGRPAETRIHRRCYAVRALADGFVVIIPGGKNFGLRIRDDATGRVDEIRKPGTHAVGGFFASPACEIAFDPTITGYEYPVNVRFLHEVDSDNTRDKVADPMMRTRLLPKDINLDKQAHRVIILHCANALSGEDIPPTHSEVCATLKRSRWEDDRRVTYDGVKRQLWQRSGVRDIEKWMIADHVSFPEGDAFRAFAVKWLADTGRVTHEMLAAVVGDDPTSVVSAVRR